MLCKIKSQLVSKGIKMKDFACQVGITPTHLSRISNGKVIPRKELMYKISDLLNVSIQELFFED